MSKDADEMLRFADYCHEKSQDEINWNLGCPYPRVANKKRGSGMLMFPDMVYQILEKVISESPIKWSIKCRLGYLSADEIKALAPIFNEFDISELIIHARLGKQLYKGEVDLDNFHEALSLIKAPIAYNGDIFTTTDFQKLQNRFPITRWMIGRGLLVDPFLPAAIMGSVLPTLDDQQFAIRKFVEDLYLTYRKQMNDRPQAISVMKELWGFMAYGFNKPQKIFNTIKKCNSFESYETAVSKAFSDFQWLGSDADLYRAKLAKEE